jgi:hypothetical protein
VRDRQARPGPEDAIDASFGTAHQLTSVLSSDAVILMLAREALAKGHGSPAAHIAARRGLDREVRELLPWPTGEDYERAAEDYERMGRMDDAALLRRMAATDTLIAAAKAEWNTRYDARPTTSAAEMIGAMRQEGMIDFDPAGPFIGVDGAAYEPGALTIGGEPVPVLVITGRGAAELVTDWPSFDGMAGWVASRGSTASGPLTPPGTGPDCRGWAEDKVLARLIVSARDARLLTAELSPDTFTTDVRYDVYQTILALVGRGGYFTPEQLAAELGQRVAAVPSSALVNYGGRTGPFPRAYVARLASTEVTSEAGAAAALALMQEDENHRARMSRPATRAKTSGPVAAADSRPGQTRAPGLPLRQPRPFPGPGSTTNQQP